MKPILLFPTGNDTHGRTNYTGIEFKTLTEMSKFVSNSGGFANATIISNGTLYEATDIAQAISDSN